MIETMRISRSNVHRYRAYLFRGDRTSNRERKDLFFRLFIFYRIIIRTNDKIDRSRRNVRHAFVDDKVGHDEGRADRRAAMTRGARK